MQKGIRQFVAAVACLFIFDVIATGLYRDFNNWLDQKVQARAIQMANEIASRHTESMIKREARKYTDAVLSKNIMFPKAYEKVMGYDKPQYCKDSDKYTEKYMIVESTAYWNMDPVEASGDGIAFDGTKAVPYKTIAVDPKVIPLQSEVYVPSIGWCRANDTGNAIVGRIIDVTMGSRTDAWNWGRRLCYIRIRTPKKEK